MKKVFTILMLASFGVSALAQSGQTPRERLMHARIDKTNQNDADKAISEHLQRSAAAAAASCYPDSIYEFDSDSLLNSKITYTYDGNNNLTLELSQYWDGSNWANSYRSTSTYDGNNNEIAYLGENWDGSNWVNSYQGTYTYDGNNNQIANLDQQWDGSNWVNDYRTTYTYDGNDNEITYLDEEWDGSSWANSYRYNSTYCSDNCLLSRSSYSWDGSSWLLSYSENTFCGAVTGIAENGVSTFSVYPNPNQGQFVVEGRSADYTIDIYNNMGQLLLSQRAVQERTQLNLQQQPSGIYHVSVIANKEVSRFKLVKQ